MPKEVVSCGNQSFTISFDEILVCPRCGNKWVEKTNSSQVECTDCRLTTGRNVVGKRHERYLKYEVLSGDEESCDEVVESLEMLGDKFRAMKESGWELNETTDSSVIVFTKGHAESEKIV